MRRRRRSESFKKPMRICLHVIKKKKKVGACAHESYQVILLSYVIIYSSRELAILLGLPIFVLKSRTCPMIQTSLKRSSLSGLRVQVDRKSSAGRFRALAELFLFGLFFSVLLFFDAGRASGRVQRRRRSCKSGSVYF